MVQQQTPQRNSLADLIQQMLQNGYGGLGNNQVNNAARLVQAQMAAKDPKYAAGAVVGKVLNSWLQTYLQNYIKARTEKDVNNNSSSNPPEINSDTTKTLASNAIDAALPISTEAQRNFLGTNNALTNAVDYDELFRRERLKGLTGGW